MSGVGAKPGSARDAWLTTFLRPAGELDEPAMRQLGEALSHLAASSDMAVLDLSAARVPLPGAFAARLREPAAEFERAGRCLLLVGAPGELTAELSRETIPVVTLDANVLARPMTPAA
ncbi:MAG TPA: hypothetical protein VG142_09170 [Trebonia sp.]|nr:hypothetical protein [Trebonia sp.]